jgi:hypothetical protein
VLHPHDNLPPDSIHKLTIGAPAKFDKPIIKTNYCKTANYQIQSLKPKYVQERFYSILIPGFVGK